MKEYFNQCIFLFTSCIKLYISKEHCPICFSNKEPYFPNGRFQNQSFFQNSQMEQRLQIHQNQRVCRSKFNFDKVVTEWKQGSSCLLQCQLTHLPFIKAVGELPGSQLFSCPPGRLLRCESWLPNCSVQPRLQGLLSVCLVRSSQSSIASSSW